MIVLLAVLSFWLFSVGLSLLSREDFEYSRSYLFKAGGVAGFVALMCWAAWSVALPRDDPHEALFRVPAFVLVTIVGVALALRFWTSLIGDLFEQGRKAMMGEDRMKVEKSFDLARKAEKEANLDESCRLYAEGAREDPGNPEPLRRMAEIRLQQGRAEEALSHLRAAFKLIPSSEDKATLAFRISDLLVPMGRLDEAREVLQSVERDLAGTRFADYARERLGRLP